MCYVARNGDVSALAALNVLQSLGADTRALDPAETAPADTIVLFTPSSDGPSGPRFPGRHIRIVRMKGEASGALERGFTVPPWATDAQNVIATRPFAGTPDTDLEKWKRDGLDEALNNLHGQITGTKLRLTPKRRRKPRDRRGARSYFHCNT